MIERTLVIGSTGFVGRAVVGVMAAGGWNVTAMRRWNSSEGVLEGMDVREVVADLSQPEELAHAISNVNYVVYCAAPDPTLPADAYRRRATLGMRRVLNIARDEDVERLVVTSSAVTIGRPDGEGPADEEDYYLPGEADDHFVEAAYAVEQECFRESADGQEIVTVNPTVVVGPGAVVPARSMLSGVDDADPVNWVDLGKVARAHVGALESGRRGSRYIVGSQNATIGEFYERIAAESEVETRRSRSGAGEGPYRNRYLLTGGQWVDGSRAERAFDL